MVGIRIGIRSRPTLQLLLLPCCGPSIASFASNIPNQNAICTGQAAQYSTSISATQTQSAEYQLTFHASGPLVNTYPQSEQSRQKEEELEQWLSNDVVDREVSLIDTSATR